MVFRKIVKNEVFGKKLHFLFLPFYVGERQTEKKKQRKKKIAAVTEKYWFWGGWEKVDFVENGFVFGKIGKHYLCLEGEKRRFRQHRKTDNSNFLLKVGVFGRVLQKIFTTRDPQKLCSAENTIL